MSETKKNENTNEVPKKGKENKGFSKAETLGGMAAAAGLGVAGTMAAQALNKDDVDDADVIDTPVAGGGEAQQEEEPVAEVEEPILTAEEINEIRIEPEEPTIEIAEVEPTPITGLEDILPEIDLTQPVDDNLYADVIIEPGKEDLTEEIDPDVIDVYDPDPIDITTVTDIITEDDLFAHGDIDCYDEPTDISDPTDDLLASNDTPDIDLLGDIIV